MRSLGKSSSLNAQEPAKETTSLIRLSSFRKTKIDPPKTSANSSPKRSSIELDVDAGQSKLLVPDKKLMARSASDLRPSDDASMLSDDSTMRKSRFYKKSLILSDNDASDSGDRLAR